jgi:hypothetical protein
MTSTPGHIYRVGTRFFVDSQALRQIAEHLDLVPTASGYRFLEPAIELELVEGRPPLPNQRGQLYLVPADSSAHGACLAWLRQGHMQGGGEFDVWPGGCACRLPTARETAE